MESIRKISSMVFIWLLAVFYWKLIQFPPDIENQQLSSGDFDMLTILLAGIFFGCNFFLINKIIKHKKMSLNKLSYGGLIFVYSLLHCVSFLLMLILMVGILGFVQGEKEPYNYLSSRDVFKVYLYTSVVSIGIFFIQIVNQKFGPGVLKDLILGNYRKPKERSQIFLFIDLKSSTSYAERLGHVKYSHLIQDCFADLTPAAVENKAQIYQYVGDEVVFTWPYEKGIAKGRCVNLFYQYKKIINNKAAYYMKNYGLVPEFKGGLNGGVLMTAEVGIIKRSIAYHGDVINTASRLQHMCSELNKEFLISESIVKDLPANHQLAYEYVGAKKIKGKKNKVGVFASSFNHH